MMKWLFLIGLCISHVFKAIDIGSDSVVNRFNTQQILSTGDRVAGFATLVGGFRLDGGLTRATFDSFMPVSGTVEQDGGTLILNRNICFESPVEWLTIGSIVGNEHLVELARTMTVIPFSSFAGPSGGKTQRDCEITFTLNVNLTQAINSVSWSHDDRYIAVGCNSSSSQEVRIYEFNQSTMTAVLRAGAELGANVLSVAWHPSKHILAVGRNAGSAEELYTFTYNQAVPNLTQLNAFDFGSSGNAVNAVAWHPSGNHLAVAGATNSAEIRVYPVNTDGTLNGAGVFTIDISGNTDAKTVAWDVSGNYLAVGLASALINSTELQIYSFSISPSINLTLNASVTFNSAVNTVSWNPIQPNVLAVGLAAGTSRLRLFSHNPGAGTLLEIATGLELATQVMSSHWRNASCLAIGKVANSAGELSTLRFSNNLLNLEEDIEVGFAINDVQWSHSGNFLMSGSSNGDLTIYLLDSAFVGTILYFSDLGLCLNADLTLRNCNICFQGNSFIDGQDHTLSLEPTCTVSIAANSTLQCSNVTLKGLAGTSLQGLASSSKLVLDNSSILLDQDYIFRKGMLDIVRDVYIRGDAYFTYESDSFLTIRSQSSLRLLSDLTFKYNPISANASLFRFTDSSSKLIFENARLYAASSIHFTKGMVQILESTFFETDNSILFGNGTVSNDTICMINRDALLVLVRGMMIYNNILPGSWNMAGRRSRFTVSSGCKLGILQDLVLGAGVIEFHRGTYLARAVGKKITGAMHTLGNISLMNM